MRRQPFAIGSEPGLLALDDTDKPVVLELMMPAGDFFSMRLEALFGDNRETH